MNDVLVSQLNALMDVLRTEGEAMARTLPRNRRDKARYSSMLARTSQRLHTLEELRTAYSVSSILSRSSRLLPAAG
jgi:hypothetical protein